MEKIIFVEKYQKDFNFENYLVISLNVLASYELRLAGIKFFEFTDFISHQEYLSYESEYNRLQLSFFDEFDQLFDQIYLNDDVKFLPLRIYGYDFKFLIDSLFSQALLLKTLIRKLNPESIALLTEFSKTDDEISYCEVRGVNNYAYLNWEILNFLSRAFEKPFGIINIPVQPEPKYSKYKTLKNIIKNSTLFTIYEVFNSSNSRNKDNIKPIDLNILESKKLLFLNLGWGLNKLFSASLIKGKNTSLMYNGLFFDNLRNIGILKPYRITPNNKSYDFIPYISKFLGSNNQFVEYITSNLGVDIRDLINNRTIYITKNILPEIYNKAAAYLSLLVQNNIEIIIGNQKSTLDHNILAYIGTYSSRYKFIFFTHGYDTYDVDRTLLELPCNYYVTMDSEIAEYFKHKFSNQTFFKTPDDVLENSIFFK